MADNRTNDPLPVGTMDTPYRWKKNDPLWIPEISEGHYAQYEKLKKELKLEQQALEDGHANLPQSSDEVLNEPQLRVQERVLAGMSILNEFLIEQLGKAHQGMVADPTILDVDAIAATAEAEKEKALQASPQLAEANTKLLTAERDYKFFRETNKLHREAHYRESPYLFFAVLFGLLVLESFANAMLLRHLSSQGWVGGVFLAAFISVVNIILGVFGGAVGWRLAGHRNVALRILGWLVTVASMLLAFGWNIYVAHFREVAEAAIQSGAVGSALLESALDTWPHIQENGLFGLSTMLSWLLFAVGLFVFLMVCREGWEDMADRYWDYKKFDVFYRDANSDYLEEFETFKAQINTRISQVLDAARAHVDASRQRFRKAEALADLAEQRFGEVAASEARWVQEGNNLLKYYRDQNDRVRNSPPPTYWPHFPSPTDYREGRLGIAGSKGMIEAQSRWRDAAQRMTEIRDRKQTLAAEYTNNRDSLIEIERAMANVMRNLPKDIEEFRKKLEQDQIEKLKRKGAIGETT